MTMLTNYQEKQKIDNLIWFIMLAVLAAGNMYFYRFQGETSPDILFWSMAMLLFFGLFLFLFSLETRFSPEGITYRLLPFQRKWKHIQWSEIESAEIQSVKPIREYGGYGYRISKRFTAYIMHDKKALVLHLSGSDKRLVFSIQNEETVRSLLRSRLSKKQFSGD